MKHSRRSSLDADATYPRQHIVWHSGGASKEIAHVLSRIAVRKVKQQDEQRLGMRSNVWRVAPNPINAHDLSGSRKEHSTMTAGASPMVLASSKMLAWCVVSQKRQDDRSDWPCHHSSTFSYVFQFLSRENSRILDSACP